MLRRSFLEIVQERQDQMKTVYDGFQTTEIFREISENLRKTPEGSVVITHADGVDRILIAIMAN